MINLAKLIWRGKKKKKTMATNLVIVYGYKSTQYLFIRYEFWQIYY